MNFEEELLDSIENTKEEILDLISDEEQDYLKLCVLTTQYINLRTTLKKYRESNEVTKQEETEEDSEIDIEDFIEESKYEYLDIPDEEVEHEETIVFEKEEIAFKVLHDVIKNQFNSICENKEAKKLYKSMFDENRKLIYEIALKSNDENSVAIALSLMENINEQFIDLIKKLKD